MFISIIIPVYNAEPFLDKTIQSILSQTYKNFQLILIDDGSKDNSLQICYRYQREDSRILVLSQENAGSSAARNYGLIKATGDYIMFVDADDCIEENMLEELVKIAKEKNPDIVMCGLYKNFYDKNKKLIESKVFRLKPRYIKGNKSIANGIIDLFENEKINGPTCKLIRKKLIIGNEIMMPVGIHLQEDLLFNVKVLCFAESIYVTDKCFYHYNNYNVESVTKRYYQNKFEMLNYVHNYVVEYFELRTKNNDILARAYYLYIKNVYAGFLNLFHDDCVLSRREKIDYIEGIITSNEYNEKLNKSKRSGFKYTVLKSFLQTKNKYIIYYFTKLLYYLKKYLKMKY
ncbi:glycosyltransferase family 2 protein [Ureibacillus sp. FSL K6-3587]|uniref:glycosyltransferase family 2 protein n=1 Tax=Ureibacillus sp. FSL K6-3587 TaxID=2954681 RepID=UPI00315800DF